MTATIVPPADTMLPRHSLQLSDLPTQRMPTHGYEQFGCGVHTKIVLPVTSHVNQSQIIISPIISACVGMTQFRVNGLLLSWPKDVLQKYNKPQ